MTAGSWHQGTDRENLHYPGELNTKNDLKSMYLETKRHWGLSQKQFN